MGWRENLARGKQSGGGNFFKDGKGRVIVKDVKMIKGHEDPETFVAELYVKESAPIERDSAGNWVQPNPPGSSVSYIQQMTLRKEVATGNSNAFIKAVLGPDAEKLSEAEFIAEMDEVMHVDATPGPNFGYSNENTVSPARGMELLYETYRTLTRREVLIVVVKFTHVPPDAATIEANRKVLAGIQG